MWSEQFKFMRDEFTRIELIDSRNEYACAGRKT